MLRADRLVPAKFIFSTFCCTLFPLASVLAERPASYRLLPEKTLAYVRIGDVQELVDRFRETSIGRMAQEQQIRALSSQLYGEAQTVLQPFEDETDLTLDELLLVLQGEVTIAIVAPPNGFPAPVLMMDVDKNRDTVPKILGLVESKLEEEGLSKSTETVDGTTINIYAQNDERWTGFVHFQKDDTLVATSNLDVAQQILAAWRGDEEQTVLEENRDFTAVVGRSQGPRGETPHIRWFVDPVSLAKVASRGNIAAQTGLAMLPVVGADGLLAIGGSITLASKEYDSFVQMHVLTDEPRRGALAMVALESGEATPEEWVPHDVASYQTMHWNLQKTQQEFQILFDSFAGEGAFEKRLVQTVRDEGGIDLVEDVIEQFAGRYSFATWLESPFRFGDVGQIVGGIQLREDHDLQTAIETLMERSGQEIEQEMFAGVTYYKTPTLGGDQDDNAGDTKPKPIQICFAIADNYLLISSRPTAMERALGTRTEAKSLADALDFKLIASKLKRQHGGGRAGYFGFGRPEESFRAWYELATAESTKSQLAEGAEKNPFLGKLSTALDQNPLPPFAVIRKYLAPTGSIITADKQGFHYTGFGLRRNP